MAGEQAAMVSQSSKGLKCCVQSESIDRVSHAWYSMDGMHDGQHAALITLYPHSQHDQNGRTDPSTKDATKRVTFLSEV